MVFHLPKHLCTTPPITPRHGTPLSSFATQRRGFLATIAFGAIFAGSNRSMVGVATAFSPNPTATTATGITSLTSLNVGRSLYFDPQWHHSHGRSRISRIYTPRHAIQIPTTLYSMSSSSSSSYSTSTTSTSTTIPASTPATLCFNPQIDVRDRATSTILIGRHAALKSVIDKSDAYVSLFGFRPHPDILGVMYDSLGANSPTGSSSSSHVLVPTVGPAAPRPPHKITLCSLANKVSRNNHPLSLHALTDLVRGASSASGGGGNKRKGEKGKKGEGSVVHVMVLVEENFPLGPIGAALGRAFPLFCKKTKTKKGGGSGESSESSESGEEESSDDGDGGDDVDGGEGEGSSEKIIHVTFLNSQGKVIKNDAEIKAAEAAAEGVRLACRLVDTHPEELTTSAFAQECRTLFENDETVTIEEYVGDELKEKGYGGIYNVGKAAVEPPRLIIMTYDPPNDVLSSSTSLADNEEGEENTQNTQNTHPSSIALVGKGIVYDTGGLAIKSRLGMSGMKHDMGGAAGVLGGFMAAVQLRTPRTIRLLLCLAENAIGPASVRNDDIITLYSGKTVEINNSDAEGRLVLGDGVAHVTKHYGEVDLVVDMATLTGAQLICTGKMHAGILANEEEWEKKAVQAGLASGDLCYPMLYAPELLKKEFNSKVADMKNSVKDRSNAQSSCAGHFIESHLDPSYKGGWLHVDMAGPGSKNERGTGYGVGLVLSLVGAPGFDERS